MRSIRRIPQPKHAPKSFLKLIGNRAAAGVPVQVWSEVAKCALRNRVTTSEVLMAALAEYLRSMRREA